MWKSSANRGFTFAFILTSHKSVCNVSAFVIILSHPGKPYTAHCPPEDRDNTLIRLDAVPYSFLNKLGCTFIQPVCLLFSFLVVLSVLCWKLCSVFWLTVTTFYHTVLLWIFVSFFFLKQQLQFLSCRGSSTVRILSLVIKTSHKANMDEVTPLLQRRSTSSESKVWAHWSFKIP